MRILGIDPGTTRLGYGLIEKGRELKLLTYGVLEIKGKRGEPAKIFELGKKLAELIDELKPDLAGVEKLYFAKNQKTAMLVSQARGVILHLLVQKNIPVRELRPGDVKIAVTNYGLADKKAVARMTAKILKIEGFHGYDDASDALAVAIAAAYHHDLLTEKRA
ncbi:MAG: crossover junction endodeoxyribonuclease RuvC [Parcubacteria group bacterium Gr01-1014_73]|nr:MAG: crossover junction endodeoxyribonuclease RuvC [Parcubacteria group bacterium Gr01-1014_73]